MAKEVQTLQHVMIDVGTQAMSVVKMMVRVCWKEVTLQNNVVKSTEWLTRVLMKAVAVARVWGAKLRPLGQR